MQVQIGRFSIISLLTGISGTGLLFIFRRSEKLLAYLGSFAYSIYLFHVFGTAGSRIVLQKLGLADHDLMVFFVSLGFGLIVPIIIEKIFASINILRLLFLGLRPIPDENGKK